MGKNKIKETPVALSLDPIQQKIIDSEHHLVVLGSSGSGKTTAMVCKIQVLIASGVKPEEIAVIDFSHQSKLYLQKLLEKNGAVQVDSFRHFAQQALEVSGEPVKYPTNRQMRRLLRQAMREVDFPGSVMEAEHVLRKFKSRARKPHENERFYLLFQCYKAKCAFDRFDVVRKHLLDMRASQAPASAVRYVFVDNFQDISQIQLLWLMEHMKNGVKVCVFGDDDLQVMSLSGSLGTHAFDDFADIEGVESLTLENDYRHGKRLHLATLQCVFPIKGRLSKKQQFVQKHEGTLRVQAFEDMAQESRFLLEQVQALSAKGTIGLLVRDDWQALYLHHLLNKKGIQHGCFANSLWETPGAIMVLDLLHVLLNRAQDVNLKNVMLGFGLNAALVDAFFASGLVARDWLKNGGHLPEDVELPSVTMKEYTAMQRLFQGYYKMMIDRSIAPQDAFKALCYDFLMKMGEADRRYALLAVDTLISMKGDLFAKLEEIRSVKLFDVSARVVVAPVRYARNMEFDFVLMPHVMASQYPQSQLKALGVDVNHNRRLFYTGLSRAKKEVLLTYVGAPSAYVTEVKKGY